MAAQQPDFIDNPGFATGFGSFAFHPAFDENGLLYTTHTEPSKTAPADFALPDSVPSNLQWVITEWKTDDPQAATFTGTHRELLRADMKGNAHGFQELTFNPLAQPGEADYGLLYWGWRRRTSPEWVSVLCDNPGVVWSSVLRIDPAGTNSANGHYGIPKDNPFVGDADALGEVWAYGFRNPHRISWDQTGSKKMFITNIGQHSVEEVNLGVAGANYGWPEREGTFLFDVLANPELVYPLPSDDAGYTYPVAQYDHDEGNAVSGGFVYAGTDIPQLKGKYLFGDIPRGRLFYAAVDAMELGQQAPVYEMDVELRRERRRIWKPSPAADAWTFGWAPTGRVTFICLPKATPPYIRSSTAKDPRSHRRPASLRLHVPDCNQGLLFLTKKRETGEILRPPGAVRRLGTH